MKATVEYIWLDGTNPTPQLRSKTRIVELSPTLKTTVLSCPEKLPEWGFDGSSTGQADGHKSDVILRPVAVFQDPLRKDTDAAYLAMCETFNADGSPNSTNHRIGLREALSKGLYAEAWVGFEQEYFLCKDDAPLGWVRSFSEVGYFGRVLEKLAEQVIDYVLPEPQGPFYCGVGAGKVAGRDIAEKHLAACLKAGIGITGINSEVAIGQWEFQVFHQNLMVAGDHLWVARWLLHRIAEDHGVSVNLHPKPFSGDVNGSGLHTNFSTKMTREGGPDGSGMDYIIRACEAIGKRIPQHLEVYGVDNHLRLTGKHETCSISEFRYGVSDRGASIRIPLHVAQAKAGYFEDRRPASNADPYRVAKVILETISE